MQIIKTYIYICIYIERNALDYLRDKDHDLFRPESSSASDVWPAPVKILLHVWNEIVQNVAEILIISYSQIRGKLNYVVIQQYNLVAG